MSPTVERIIAEIDALTSDERGELPHVFLDSFEPSSEVALAWESEVRRRLTEAQLPKWYPCKGGDNLQFRSRFNKVLTWKIAWNIQNIDSGHDLPRVSMSSNPA